jgi:hypothetical protein
MNKLNLDYSFMDVFDKKKLRKMYNEVKNTFITKKMNLKEERQYINTFINLINNILPDNMIKLINSNRVAKYSFYFKVLDISGIDRFKDKSTEKSFAGGNLDSSHALSASLCDYFITFDEKLSNKSKEIFNMFDIKTKVIYKKIYF